MKTLHIYPPGDAIKHNLESEDCICGPDITINHQPNGDLLKVVTHAAMDGRPTPAPGPEELDYDEGDDE